MSGADNNRRTIIMRTVRTKIYKLDELPTEAQNKAIQFFNYINVDCDWWDSVYEDAKQVGLKIKEFNTYRSGYCKGEFIYPAYDVANKIKENHGEACETYKTAIAFIAKWDALVVKHSDGITTDKVAEDNEYKFDQAAEDIENEFIKIICEDYRILLSKEYDYLTSDESVMETIRLRQYEFTKDGLRFQ